MDFQGDSALRWSGLSTLRSSNECDISNNWEFVLKSFQANLHWILHSNLHKNCNLQKHMICYCDSIPDLLHLWFWRGATHNRFFHSIGTAYLAMTFIQNLRHEQPHLQVTDRDEMCVTLAGLCHDLGHPCFSHSDCLEIRVVSHATSLHQLAQSAASLRSYVWEQLVMMGMGGVVLKRG